MSESRKLSIALEEGFLHDRVRISAGGRELAAFDDLSTRVQIGLARSLDVEIPEGEQALLVELPDKRLKTEIAIGGTAYFERHRGDGNIVLVSESDFGADRVWRIDQGLAPANSALGDRIAALVAPLGIVRGTAPANGGADLGAWARAGVAAIDLNQDGTRYFDYHHTPDDTLDKVDPVQLRQNVAAWTAMLAATANAPEAIERVPAAPSAD